MLLWQPNERNKYLFLLELIVISMVAHLILGFFLFVAYKGGTTSFRIELGKPHSTTLFMPLRRHAGNGHGSVGRRGGHGIAARTASMSSKKCSGLHCARQVHGVQQSSQSLEQGAESVASVAEKQRHHLGSTTTMGWDTPSAKMRHVTKKASAHGNKSKKSDKKKNLVHKEQPKKAAVQKKKEQQVKILKQDASPKPVKALVSEISPVRKLEPKIEEKPVIKDKAAASEVKIERPVAQPEPKAEELVQDPQEPDDSMQNALNQGPELAKVSDSEGPGDYGLDEITLGQEYDGEFITAEQAHMYECIEQEIVSRWRPPRGLSKDLVCQIKCSIGGSGTVVACKFEKSSGVLIYDMAARSAARAMMLPRWAWGKDFTIIFKQ
jgi:hypothetical protein